MDGHISTTLPAPPPRHPAVHRPAKPSDRSSPPVQLSREQILSATARCLHETGYDGTTIRRIASMLGCAVGSIYRYFKDKRQLLDAVTQQRLESVAKLVEANAEFDLTIREYHQCATRGVQEYRLMFWLACVGQPPAAAAQTADGATPAAPPLPPLPPLPQVVQKIIDGWARRLGDADAARQAWALLHGSITLGHTADECVRAVRALVEESAAPTPTAPSDDADDDHDVAPPIARPPATEDVVLL